MILAKMEEIGGRHCWNGAVQECAAESSLRRGDGRLESAGIAKSRRSAVSFNLLFVNFQYFIDGQKNSIHKAGYKRLLGQFAERFFIVLVCPFLSRLKLFAPGRCLHRRDD